MPLESLPVACTKKNGFIALRIHSAGFGPARENADFFNDSDENVRLTETEPLKDRLFQRGPNYARDPDAIPDEPGVVKFDAPGVSPPSCVTVRTRNILMLRGLRNFKAR